MRAFFLFLLITACSKPDASTPEEQSACHSKVFEESRFTVCDPAGGTIELVAAGPSEQPVRRLAELEASLGPRARGVAFAMNAGMYDEGGRPIGLAIADGVQKHPINRRKGGGNFHLMPNGVFQVFNDGRSAVVASDQWTPSPAIRLATQSGPMLVIHGKLHPAFDADGTSRYVRNAVGVGADGRAIFVISDGPVSFGKLARFFRDDLKTRMRSSWTVRSARCGIRPSGEGT
ncbi:phosphodiester glycosidase family protein [Sphingomonas daechungensis]|uniref:phosphodiester glycosidase family protein n=1 Tax=Sphingomonas daechungensis TaxID=1176646 RepID=UPI001CB90031|nr:phosphodiester glycosidase family protein [Sphingomonas daechungensis]